MTGPSVQTASTTAKAIAAAIFAAVVLTLWVAGSYNLPNYILPGPRDVLAGAGEFFTSSRSLGHLASTLIVIGSSIAISFTAGAALALAAFYVPATAPFIHHRLSPFLNSFSGIGWTLLAVIWFGVSRMTVIFSISVVLLPFALVNLREGLKSLDGELGEMARSFGRSTWRRFSLIVVPALFPFAAATLRIMFGVSWKIALTAELFGGSSGLGYLINLSRQEFDTRTIFTVILFIIVAVYLADRFVFLPMERATTRRFGAAR
jgi:NitT/TauT family transport system permease protein/sulfonate transport system permease protein